MYINMKLVLIVCVTGTAWAYVGFKFNESKLAFAEFKPWDVSTNGAIELYFQTEKPDALLLYQDDGEGNDWIDVFLINGIARLRLRMGTCDQSHTMLNGTFTDSKWHHLIVERNFSLMTFSIDGIRSESLTCENTDESPMKPKPHKSSLYLGGIPLFSKSQGHWANPNIFREAQYHRFTGCIARVRYSNGEKKLRKAKKKSLSGITTNCQGACAGKNSKACKNGGKCVDMLVSIRCDCRGTGFHGKYCDKEGTITRRTFVNATAVTLVNTTSFVSAHARGKVAAVQPLYETVLTMLCGIRFIWSFVSGE